VQRCAMTARKDGVNFKIILINDRKLRKYMNLKEIEDCFNFNYHMAHVDRIFKKVGI